MPRDFFGKILSLGLGSPIPSSRTMVFSLIAKSSRGTVVTWDLRIGIPPSLSIREWTGQGCQQGHSEWTQEKIG